MELSLIKRFDLSRWVSSIFQVSPELASSSGVYLNANRLPNRKAIMSRRDNDDRANDATITAQDDLSRKGEGENL